MSEEIFDVVDEADRVIGQATRSDVHTRGLLHRAVNIFVFNSRGQLLLQRRSATKDQFPLCYTSSASGHVDAGETYEHAAVRELQEELGLNAALTFLAKFPASAETANEHSAIYSTVTDDPPTFDADEIESGCFEDIKEIAALMDQHPEQFAPPFRVLFRWYVETFVN